MTNLKKMLFFVCGKSSGNQKSNIAGFLAIFMTHRHLRYIFIKTVLISLIFKKHFLTGYVTYVNCESYTFFYIHDEYTGVK